MDLPRAIVMKQFESVKQIAIANDRRTGQQAARVTMLPHGHLPQRAINFTKIVDMRRAGR